MNETLLTKANTKIFVGKFFERLTAKLFGAEMFDNYGDTNSYPDVVKWGNGRKDTLFESKAGSKHNGIIADLGQIDSYKQHAKDGFPFTLGAQSYYTLWIYNLNDLKKTYRILGKLESALAKAIEFGIQIPLADFYNLKTKCAVQFYNSKFWTRTHSDRFMRIRYRVCKSLVTEPKEISLRFERRLLNFKFQYANNGSN